MIKEKQKIYFKVATKNTADYFVDLMTAMLCLTNMEWYSKYNGKNMGGIVIPKVLTKSIRNKQYQQNNSKKKSNSVKPYVSLTQLGIPLDLNFFKQNILHSSNSKFNTIAECTLEDVRIEFFGMQNKWTDEKVLNELKKYTFSTQRELHKQNSALAYAANARGFLDYLPKVGVHNYLPKDVLQKAQKENVLIIDAADSVGLKVHQYNRQLKYYGLFKAKTPAERNKQASSKVVLCYDKTMKFIKEYESVSEAARKLKLKGGNISAVCLNKVKTAGGFIWKYKK